MQSVGIRLREAREQKGYSLDDVNLRTRINSKNLAAIERDEVQEISSPFFYRSFVRQYAETVGLDFHILSAGVEALAVNMRQPDLPGQGEHQIVRVAPLQARRKRDWSWVVPAAFLLGIVVVGSGGFAYLKYFGFSALQNSAVGAFFSKPSRPKNVQIASAPAAAKDAAADKPVLDLRPKISSKASPAPASLSPQDTTSEVKDPPLSASSAVPAPETILPPPVTDKIRLELAATERTWLSVSADGKPAYTGILEPLETKTLEGQENARLRTGNAGGVTVIFNGKSIGAIGPRGTTRTVIFSKTGYEIQPGDGVRLRPVNHVGG